MAKYRYKEDGVWKSVSPSQKEHDDLRDDFNSHLAEKATKNDLGHVKVDNKTIFVDDGVISSARWDDTTGSPGSVMLLSGDMEEGFFGEVSANDLISGDDLASEVGISAGTSQHSTAGWLKFAYKGKIQFVAKKPIRHTISWNNINDADCVYGDKIINIKGLTYKVRLMRGANDKFDPKTPIKDQPDGGNGYNGELNHYSEWNRLMCQIHEEAIDKSWGYPACVEDDIGILEHSLGSGKNGMYSDDDIVMKSGDGRYSWCQEMAETTSRRLYRGYYGVSTSLSRSAPNATSGSGWRVVLELVP